MTVSVVLLVFHGRAPLLDEGIAEGLLEGLDRADAAGCLRAIR
jgi:hypothetical protein